MKNRPKRRPEAPRIRHPAMSGRTAEDPQPIEALDAALLEQDAEVVQAHGQVVLGRGIVPVGRDELLPQGEGLLLGAQGLGHPAVVGVEYGEQGIGVGQLALVGDPVGVRPDQAAPQLDGPLEEVEGLVVRHLVARVEGLLAQVHAALGHAGAEAGVAGSIAQRRHVQVHRLAQGLVRLGFRAEFALDDGQPELGGGQARLERRVVSPLADEVLVVGQRRAQQLAAQRLEARYVEEPALADAGQQLVNGGAGLGEVGLGQGAVAIGIRPARLGVHQPLLGQLEQAVGPRPLALGPPPEHGHPRAGDRQDQEQRGQRRRQGRVAPAPSPRPLGRPDPPRQDRTPLEVAPQVLGHVLGRLVAMHRLLGDRLQDDRLQVPRDRRVDLARRHGRLVGHHLHQPSPVRLVEDRAEGQELVERRAQRIDVAPGVGPPLEPLRGHVAQRAHQAAGLGERAGALAGGQAEVGDPDGAVGVEQQVRWLDVAVEDALGVGVGQGLGDVAADAGHRSEIGQFPAFRRRAGRRRGPRIVGCRGRRPGLGHRPGLGRHRRPDRSGRARLPGTPAARAAGDRRRGVGIDGVPARRLAVADRERSIVAAPSTSARSSAKTRSSPWPWMNCMA